MSTLTAPTHRVTWTGDTPTFHCDGDQSSPCHRWPDCDCEDWTLRRHADHPRVGHDDCWQVDALTAYAKDAYEDEDRNPADPPHIDGVIDTEWDGECLWWTLAPVQPGTAQ